MDNRKKILLDVPYYSQWLDVKDPDWQRRSCGVAALKMAMVEKNPTFEALSLESLIEKGLALDAYDPKHGWRHDGLIAIAKDYGFENSFRREWPEGEKENALDFIAGLIEEKIPATVSAKSANVAGGGHLALLTGFEKESDHFLGFYLNDPDSKDRATGKNKFIKTDEFLNLWKGRVIIFKR